MRDVVEFELDTSESRIGGRSRCLRWPGLDRGVFTNDERPRAIKSVYRCRLTFSSFLLVSIRRCRFLQVRVPLLPGSACGWALPRAPHVAWTGPVRFWGGVLLVATRATTVLRFRHSLPSLFCSTQISLTHFRTSTHQLFPPLPASPRRLIATDQFPEDWFCPFAGIPLQELGSPRSSWCMHSIG